MASPQTEDGYVQIANDLWDALVGAGLNKNEYRALLCILRYSYGVKETYAKLKKIEISKITRIPLPKVNETLTTLEKRNIIRLSKNNGYIYFHKDYDKWQLNETLTFDEKWKAQVNKTLTKNIPKRKVLGSRNVKSQLRRSPNRTISKGSKESIKESIKEIKYICVELFSFWKDQLNHPKALLTKDRQTKISARLKEGYTVEQCKNAIEGCKLSAYHMGDNPQGTVYDSIELIFRNGDKIEQFINIYKEVLKHGKTGKKGKRDTRKGWKESEKYRHLYRK